METFKKILAIEFKTGVHITGPFVEKSKIDLLYEIFIEEEQNDNVTRKPES